MLGGLIAYLTNYSVPFIVSGVSALFAMLYAYIFIYGKQQITLNMQRKLKLKKQNKKKEHISFKKKIVFFLFCCQIFFVCAM